MNEKEREEGICLTLLSCKALTRDVAPSMPNRFPTRDSVVSDYMKSKNERI
jgi:hypothetical protein